jgi:hypothetical protein
MQLQNRVQNRCRILSYIVGKLQVWDCVIDYIRVFSKGKIKVESPPLRNCREGGGDYWVLLASPSNILLIYTGVFTHPPSPHPAPSSFLYTVFFSFVMKSSELNVPQVKWIGVFIGFTSVRLEQHRNIFNVTQTHVISGPLGSKTFHDARNWKGFNDV